MDTLNFIKTRTAFSSNSINSVLKLVQEGATIPFIARYRKEATGGLDELEVGSILKWNQYILDLEKRKETIISAIEEQGKLNDSLLKQIKDCEDIHQLEDLYLPYKKRKKTKADIARDRGLEPLAKVIMSQQNINLAQAASKYLNQEVPTTEDALQGARDIIAEWINEDTAIREYLRDQLRKHGAIASKVITSKKEEGQVYKDYFEFQERVSKIPSHRLLAILRGQNESILRVNLVIDEAPIIYNIGRRLLKGNSSSQEHIILAVEDAYKRLLFPSIENQVVNETKERADKEAIEVFTKNLKQLLLAAPIGNKAVLAIDPGFRTGCKVACLNTSGELVNHTTIYPTAPQNDEYGAAETLKKLIDKYDIDIIAIGNGTASRETESFVNKYLAHTNELKVFMVSENGASIYSASEVGREEFPNLDLTVRGAISIGRRLMDPLAELVKIDAKSIGVGQYQHDVNQILLKESLDATVTNVVNSVGVDVNTASPHLLQYIAGLGPTIARNIVSLRSEKGKFVSRDEIKEVPRLGPKVYEQCVGFLRVRQGSHALDNTGVHPESYKVVLKMAKDYKLSIEELISNKDIVAKLPLQQYVNEKIGMPTLLDIQKELLKPGHDPRGEAQVFNFSDKIKSIEDVEPGMILPGLVGNMTNFGAFINIGIKENGLVHISQITNKFITNPSEVLTIGMPVEAKVLEVDIPRKRISLTLKF